MKDVLNAETPEPSQRGRLDMTSNEWMQKAGELEAEVERLREALQEIVDLWFRYPPLILPEGFPRVGSIARAALEEKA